MTKDQLQKELKDKVKPGVKPSHLKKLKRSKSEGDIPKAPPLPSSVPLSKSQSQLETPLTPSNSQPSLTQLQAQVRFHAETAQNYLKSLQISQAKVSELETKLKTNPPSQLLQDQLQEKQTEIENLRKQLESNSTLTPITSNPPEILTELDNSLLARHKNLKDWFTQYSQNKDLDSELQENIEEASTELLQQDEEISQLRSENKKLKLTNQSLQKDLNLATKLAELRKDYPYSPANSDYLKYGLYSLIAITFTIWLLNKN